MVCPAHFTQRTGLTLDVTDSTQFSTLYRHGRAIATLQRRRVYAKGPAWIAYDTEGRELARFERSQPATTLARRTAAALDRRETTKAAALQSLDALHPLDVCEVIRAAMRTHADRLDAATHCESRFALGRVESQARNAAEWINSDDSRLRNRQGV